MTTIKEIAKDLGISPSTVSLVLSGKAGERRISEKTQATVMQYASEHGYRPNIAARNLKENASNSDLQIVVLCSLRFQSSVFARVVTGLYQYIEQEHLHIRISIMPYVVGSLSEVHALYSRSDCHAAIICNASSEDVAALEKKPPIIPVVIYNHSSPVFFGAVMDHPQIGKIAADALADNHGQRAIVVTSSGKYSEVSTRLDSFRSRCKERGMEIAGVYTCTGSSSESRDMFSSLLHQFAGQPLPDSIFCDSSTSARGVLRALWDAHIPVPEQVRLVAVGNDVEDNDACMVPSISVVQVSIEDVAIANLKCLLEIMDGTTPQTHTTVLQSRYIPRETCGPLQIR